MAVRRKTLIVAGLIALPLLAIGLAWAQRQPIAKSYIDDALKQRGVAAQYDVADIGTSRQRIENVVIGDPAHPDLVARWVEIDTEIGLSGVAVKAVRASGVRLKGRYADGAQ
jgi:hypothetical protein